MDEEEALQAVTFLQPKITIPVHYNLPALFTKKNCRADVDKFRKEVEKLGSKCVILDKDVSCTI